MSPRPPAFTPFHSAPQAWAASSMTVNPCSRPNPEDKSAVCPNRWTGNTARTLGQADAKAFRPVDVATVQARRRRLTRDVPVPVPPFWGARVIEAANIDRVFCAGPLMEALWDALPPARRGGWAPAAADLAPALATAVLPGDVIMAKGSHASNARAFIDALIALGAPEPHAP